MARRPHLRPEGRAGVIERILREGDNATCFYAACGAGVTHEQVRALYRRVRMTGDPSWVQRFEARFPAEVLGETTRRRVQARRRLSEAVQARSEALERLLAPAPNEAAALDGGEERGIERDWEQALTERLERLRSGSPRRAEGRDDVSG